MKMKIVFAVLMLFLLVLYLFGPGIIHRYIRLRTPVTVIEANEKLYYQLAYDELKSIGNISEKKAQRDSLYLWFHVRGIKIDDGDETKELFTKWQEIFKAFKEE